MLENNNQDNLSTEEIVEETQEVSQPVVESVEKTYTQKEMQEKINSVLKKEREKLAHKAEKKESSYEERLTIIEEERRREKEEAELRAELAKEATREVLKDSIKTYISSKVKETHIDRIYKITLSDAGEENSIDKLKEIADIIISEFPGVEKAETPAGTTLNRAATPTPKEVEPKTEEGYYSKSSGIKLNITDEQYKKMSFVQKEDIIKK